MRISDLENKKIVIWGVGREGRAAAGFIRRRFPDQKFTFIDENPCVDADFLAAGDRVLHEAAQIADALNAADVIIKSPGVSLYHPLLRDKKPTSLLNLWLAEPHAAKILCVTGTKGKSTTAALLAHVLQALGHKAALLGNIGVPVTEFDARERGYAIVEISSYQAANLTETCDIGIVTSLFPEHLDWHKSLQAYYRDKLNVLAHSRIGIINADAKATVKGDGIDRDAAVLFNDASGFHVKDGVIYEKNSPLGLPPNAYLSRAHNLMNVCAALAVLRQVGIEPQDALPKMASFRALPHRQQELGVIGGILFVNDSISTTPQSAIAAMEAYPDRAVTLLIGGQDRGIDYAPLIDYVQQKNTRAVICMGASGRRIYEQLKAPNVFLAASLADAVALAREKTPAGGVVLLSPAAPSYDMFHNFEERGDLFAKLARQEKDISCPR
ncbi:MAG: UDP-N-acetylmuramoyl-L-alanine--D-glutamate ligase [Alphaproteobacteria bacterium]|nr:UDP-N-acetylmuramoyl-L-alanine--D-glutamate ligase [Alphaproteobacteria bacterium]